MKKIVGICMLSLISLSCYGLDMRGDNNILIDQDVDETLMAGGSKITLSADVYGDAFLAGQHISVNGIISEDAWFAGNVISINGEIKDDLRVGGNVITISGPVNGDVILGGNTITISNSIGGDLYVGGNVLSINGEIQGDAIIDVETLNMSQDSIINGNLTINKNTMLPNNFSGFVVGDISYSDGKGMHKEFEFYSEDDNDEYGFDFNVFRFLSLIILGSLAFWLMPNYINKAASTIRTNPGKTILYGIGIIVFVPILALILLITGVGAALGGFLLANYIFLWVFLGLFAVVFLSQWLVETYLYKHIGTTIWAKIGVMTLLSLLITILPFIVTFVLGLFGIGAGFTNDMKIIKEQL